jgi:hypothetical protein
MNEKRGRERIAKPARPEENGGDSIDQGPRRPQVERSGNDDILKRMKRVDPNQAKRYRQRTGQ